MKMSSYFKIIFFSFFVLSVGFLFAETKDTVHVTEVNSHVIDHEAGHADSHETGHESGHEEAHAHDSDAEHHGVHLDGAHVSLWWCLPFVGILLSIAIMPLVAGHFWHHNYGKVSLFWWLAFIVPFMVANGFNTGFFYILEVYLGEFIPFIILFIFVQFG